MLSFLFRELFHFCGACVTESLRTVHSSVEHCNKMRFQKAVILSKSDSWCDCANLEKMDTISIGIEGFTITYGLFYTVQ